MTTSPLSATTQAFLADLAPLVNIDAGSRNVAHVTQLAQHMKSLYDALGFHTELQSFGPDIGEGLLATNAPDAEHYDVLLNAHLDTVYPDGTAATRPLRIEDNRVLGPGVSDCKGGVLLIYYALKALPPSVRDQLKIAVLMNPDEEIGSPYSCEWLKHHAARAQRVLVAEAARRGGNLVRSRKGVAVARVTFHGRAAHAGNNPEAGANANIAALRFTLEACTLANTQKGCTVNPGVIQGGTAPNVIPETAEVQLDLRYWRDEDREDLKAKIEVLAKHTWVDGVTQTVNWLAGTPAMPYTERTEGLIKEIEAAAASLGITFDWLDMGGGSDGNHMATQGVPVIDGCGPCGGANHSSAEYLDLDKIEERIALMTEFLRQIAERNR